MGFVGKIPKKPVCFLTASGNVTIESVISEKMQNIKPTVRKQPKKGLNLTSNILFFMISLDFCASDLFGEPAEPTGGLKSVLVS